MSIFSSISKLVTKIPVVGQFADAAITVGGVVAGLGKKSQASETPEQRAAREEQNLIRWKQIMDTGRGDSKDTVATATSNYASVMACVNESIAAIKRNNGYTPVDFTGQYYYIMALTRVNAEKAALASKPVQTAISSGLGFLGIGGGSADGDASTGTTSPGYYPIVIIGLLVTAIGLLIYKLTSKKNSFSR